jgi:uncharacterized protein with GYD domain
MTYVLLTKVSPESAAEPSALKSLEEEVKERVKAHCSDVKWIANYAVMGPYDYLDIFEAPDDVVANKVSTIVRSFGHASTETWGAIPWSDFKTSLGELTSR